MPRSHSPRISSYPGCPLAISRHDLRIASLIAGRDFSDIVVAATMIDRVVRHDGCTLTGGSDGTRQRGELLDKPVPPPSGGSAEAGTVLR
ncbi:hypothetical protein GCM10010425_82950 [Streptomyces spororaveus]|uniref:Uncharacterized protein n=1 Tax=Streptomyces spororaveus TaxID=284039 RepID=A0ABQ3T2R2_9ACTN|nr:hypothetical protein Sspor_02320 [Streptomyces spororaveus]